MKPRQISSLTMAGRRGHGHGADQNVAAWFRRCLRIVAALCFVVTTALSQTRVGDGGDDDPTTFSFEADNRPVPLLKRDCTPILPSEVATLYGTPDGFAIYDLGLDVTSDVYARQRRYAERLRPVYADLSDESSWRAHHVVQGTVAIDPRVGRFKFAGGDNNPLRVVGSVGIPNGHTDDIKVVGNYAYLANQELYLGFAVIDISDPRSPRLTGALAMEGFPARLDVLFPFAYVLDGYRLRVINVSDPANPTMAATLALGNGCYGVALHQTATGTFVCVGGRKPGSDETTFWMIDISQPATPQIVAELPLGPKQFVSSLTVDGNVAYVSVEKAGTHLIDVTAPNAPHRIALYPWEGQAAAHGQHLFIADPDDGLIVLDASDKTNPRPIHFDWYLNDMRRITLDSAVKRSGSQSVHFEDTRSFLTSKPIPVQAGQQVVMKLWFRGHATADRFDPPLPYAGGFQILWDGQYQAPFVADYLPGSAEFAQHSRSFAVPAGVSTLQLALSSGRYGDELTRGTAWFDDVELLIDGVNALGNPGFEEGSDRFWLGYQHPRGVSVAGNQLLVSDRKEGVRVLDISNPEDPLVASRWTDNSEAYGTYVRGILRDGKAFLAEQYWGLKVVDFADFAEPRLLGDAAIAGFAYDIAVAGDHAYIADFFSGLWVLDVSNPEQPHIVGGYHTGDIIYSVDISDSGYLICGNLDIGRMDILDISTPWAPRRISSIPKAAMPKIKGNILYLVSNINPDLEIYDLSDPFSPRRRGAIELTPGGGRRDIAVQDALAVVVCEAGGIFVLDVSDATNPRLLSALDLEGEIPWGVAIRENLAYVAYKNAFIRIFDLSNPTELRLVSTFRDDLTWPHYMVMDGNLMHLTDYFGGVSTYDLSDPLAPVRLDRFNHLYPVDIELSGEYLYEAQFGNLNILDVRHNSQAPVGQVSVRRASCLGLTIHAPNSGAVSQVNNPLTFAAGITDAEGPNLYTGVWTFKNSASDVPIRVPAIFDQRTVRNTIQFTRAGVYSAQLTITDAAGNSVSADTVNNELPAYVIIYDPNGGFVTGGGWIESAAGSLAGNPATQGKATFGFNAKYNGANSAVPQGNLEFDFQAGGINFKSTSLDWLVVSGQRAQFKGTGFINRKGDFGFILTAIDGNSAGGNNRDRVRLQILDRSSGTIVYDNQPATEINSPLDEHALVQSGSIVIHR